MEVHGAARRDAMELFDHYWFFCNIFSTPSPKEKIPTPQGEPKPPEHRLPLPSRLSRQFSLPPDIPKPQHPEQDAVSMTSPTNPITLAKHRKKLQRCRTSVGDAGPSSMLTSPSSERSKGQSYREYRYRQRRARKWKSLSDLEHEEVQGFKDLGFVFGSRDELSPVLLKMIPGLRDRGAIDIRRPYLSEAWIVQSSAPPVLDWQERKSQKKMQEQLRFWARTVASNVRPIKNSFSWIDKNNNLDLR